MKTTAHIHTLLAAGVAALTAFGASAAGTPDLFVSDLFTGPGHMARVRPGVAYQASMLPIEVRVTPPDASWSGAQWKANRYSPDEIERRHLTCSTSPDVCAPPYYGWAAIGH